MSPYRKGVLLMVCLAAVTLSLPVTAGDDDDDKPSNTAPASGAATLTVEQRHALGVVVGHPILAQIPDHIDSFGLVLDTTTLVADVGDVTVADAMERSTRAEVTRLQGLYTDGAGASLKMLQAAKSEEAKTAAQTRVTLARFNQHWGPLARMAPAEREKLLRGVTRGQMLLLRADLPGHHSLGSLPDSAQVDVDSIQVSGRVLGIMQQSDETQSVGLLVGITHAPMGLSPGARVPVELLMPKRAGVLLPRGAVLYDEGGAYVFEQLTDKSDPARARYTRHDIKLLQRHGDGWLVTGIDNDDDIVFEGTGVLWSLEGTGAQMADNDDDD
jgi:hypothetical protein